VGVGVGVDGGGGGLFGREVVVVAAPGGDGAGSRASRRFGHWQRAPRPSINNTPPTLKAGVSKVLGGDKGKAKRADDLRTEVSQLELSIGAAAAEYARIRDINREELARFTKERRAEYGAMVENFAATQVGFFRSFFWRFFRAGCRRAGGASAALHTPPPCSRVPAAAAPAA
jgi:hypothetical protein